MVHIPDVPVFADDRFKERCWSDDLGMETGPMYACRRRALDDKRNPKECIVKTV